MGKGDGYEIYYACAEYCWVVIVVTVIRTFD